MNDYFTAVGLCKEGDSSNMAIDNDFPLCLNKNKKFPYSTELVVRSPQNI